MQRALVVGAGLAGLRTAEALRTRGFDGELLVVGDEPWAPYNRPPLSKEGLAGELSHETLVFPVRGSVTGIDWHLGQRAVHADVAARAVAFDDGSAIECDLLVAATGVSARRLDVAGPAPTAASGRHVVRTLDDAIALRARLAPEVRLVVLGAGFIGCEVAATAIGLGCDVHVVAIDPYPMLRPLGETVAAELQRRHEAHGVRFDLGQGVEAFEGDGRVTGVVLDDGRTLPADVVVEALGSQCNVEWLAGNGFDLTDGVRTDAALRPLVDEVPVDGVAIVGDIARFPNVRFDERPLRVEHWSVPTDTGRRAGAVLAAYAARTAYDEVVDQEWTLVPSFWSDQYEMRIQSFGMPSLADHDGIRLLEGALDGECIVGYHRGDELVGVVGIGMIRALLAYRDRLGREPA